MRAKTFWDKAKANYWAGREQDVYNIYDNATNMGNARSSYNRAATVAGAGRKQLEEGYKQDFATYKRKRAAEAAAAKAKKELDAILAKKPIEPDYNKIVSLQYDPDVDIKMQKQYYDYWTKPKQEADYKRRVEKYNQDMTAYTAELLEYMLTH